MALSESKPSSFCGEVAPALSMLGLLNLCGPRRLMLTEEPGMSRVLDVWYKAVAVAWWGKWAGHPWSGSKVRTIGIQTARVLTSVQRTAEVLRHSSSLWRLSLLLNPLKINKCFVASYCTDLTYCQKISIVQQFNSIILWYINLIRFSEIFFSLYYT